MKILLINPPYTRLKYLVDRYLPIGLGYVASNLEKAGHTVKIYNAENPAIGECQVNWDFGYRLDIFEDFLKRMDNMSDVVWQEIKSIIKEYHPEVIGISCKTVTYKIAKNIAEICKQLFPNVPVIFGGPHPTVCSDEVINDENCDFVVVGEGEETAVKLIDKIEKKPTDFQNIKGILFKKEGKVVNTGMPEPISDLDILPLPGRHLLLDNHNLPKTLISSMVGGIIGSRGCPFQCRFCSVMNVWGRKVRYRKPDLIIDEIEQVKKDFGTIEFYFWDDSFTLDKKRVLNFCNLLIKRKTNIAWGCHTRADLIDEEVVKMLKKSGCFKVSMGIESGCEKTLEYMKKQISLEDVRRAAKILNDNGMDWNAAFMMGLPQETEKEMRETFEFMKEIKPTRIFLSVFAPFPGTSLYDETLELGLIPDDIDWSTVETKSPKNAFVKNISEENLKKLFREMMNWIDEYNLNSDTFFHKLKIRLPFYKKHPVLFLKRSFEYIYKVWKNRKKG